MSTFNNRRCHGRIQDHGPIYENGTPAKGCNTTHVARSRRKWKRRAARAERRTEAPFANWRGSRRLPPEPLEELLLVLEDCDE